MSYTYQSYVSSDNTYEFVLKKSNSYSGRVWLMEGFSMNEKYYPLLLNTRHGLFLLLQTLPGREFVKKNSSWSKVCYSFKYLPYIVLNNNMLKLKLHLYLYEKGEYDKLSSTNEGFLFLKKKKNEFQCLMSRGEYSTVSKSKYGRYVLIINKKYKFVITTQEGRDEYCTFIKQNSLKLCHQKYMVLCSSCIDYQHKESFEMLKNTKLTHPSNKVMEAFNDLKIEDHYDIYKLFYPFLVVKDQKKVDSYYFTKFCESLSSYKTCNLVMVFNNLMNFISEFL